MRNFTIILFIFFVLFLAISLFILDPLPLYLAIFLAFIICFICLISYSGKIRGILAGLLFIIGPFLLEYILYKLKVPYFTTPLVTSISIDQLNLPITINSLFLLVTVPLLFISALFFSQKIKILINLKYYHKIFLVLTSSLLIALNFLIITQKTIDYKNFLKWLIIALVINYFIVRLYKFKAATLEIYKEMPIVLYLAIYGANALRRLETFNLIIIAILVVLYLILLYNEYKIRKVALSFKL